MFPRFSNLDALNGMHSMPAWGARPPISPISNPVGPYPVGSFPAPVRPIGPAQPIQAPMQAPVQAQPYPVQPISPMQPSLRFPTQVPPTWGMEPYGMPPSQVSQPPNMQGLQNLMMLHNMMRRPEGSQY